MDLVSTEEGERDWVIEAISVQYYEIKTVQLVDSIPNNYKVLESPTNMAVMGLHKNVIKKRNQSLGTTRLRGLLNHNIAFW